MAKVSVRRSVQQIIHCAKEALSVIENENDGNGSDILEDEMQCAIEDLEQAKLLIQDVLPRLRKLV